MKKVGLILVCLICYFLTDAQTPLPSGSPSPNSPSGYALWGYPRAGRAFVWTKTDTNWTAAYPTTLWASADNNFYKSDGGVGSHWSLLIPGTPTLGTVTNFSFTNSNGVSGNVTNPSTTPNLTLTLDTATVLATKTWANSQLNTKLNISDTAAMLANRLKISDTPHMLDPYNAAFYNASFDTISRILTLDPITGNPPLMVTIPRGGTVNGMSTVTPSRSVNIITEMADNGATWQFSVRDADSATIMHTTDTASMLLNYVTTPGYGLIKNGKSLSVDTLPGGVTTWALTKKKIDSLGNLKLNSTNLAGTLSYIQKSTGVGAIGNSNIKDNIDNISIGGTSGYILFNKTVGGKYIGEADSIIQGGLATDLGISAANNIILGTGNNLAGRIQIDPLGFIHVLKDSGYILFSGTSGGKYIGEASKIILGGDNKDFGISAVNSVVIGNNHNLETSVIIDSNHVVTTYGLDNYNNNKNGLLTSLSKVTKGYVDSVVAIGSGTVTSFSAGNLSPLFTTSVATSTTTPALSFALSNATANSVLGNNTSGSAAPSYQTSINVSGTITSSNITGTNTGNQTTTGTVSRISVTNGTTNPIIDISSSYAGQSSINTLGTIATGVWNGTTIAVSNGGTGLTSLSMNRVPFGNNTAAFQSSSDFTYDGTQLKSSVFSTNVNAATSGSIRIGTQEEVRARNVANSANIRLIGSDANDKVFIDAGGVGTIIGGSITAPAPSSTGAYQLLVINNSTNEHQKILSTSLPYSIATDYFETNGASYTINYNFQDIIFNGTTTTWTLPNLLSGGIPTGFVLRLKNAGSGNITLNAATGTQIYSTLATASILILPGQAVMMIPGSYWYVE